jgi:SnoaL-like domain
METWELAVREQVRHALAAYNFAGDRGRLDGLADCFAPAGVLVLHDGTRYDGREAIGDGLAGLLVRGPGDERPLPTHVHHHVSSTFFQAVGESEVTCRSYYLVTTQVGVDHWGRYHDTLVPDADEDRWVFVERRVSADGFHEQSLFG